MKVIRYLLLQQALSFSSLFASPLACFTYVVHKTIKLLLLELFGRNTHLPPTKLVNLRLSVDYDLSAYQSVLQV